MRGEATFSYINAHHVCDVLGRVVRQLQVAVVEAQPCVGRLGVVVRTAGRVTQVLVARRMHNVSCNFVD